LPDRVVCKLASAPIRDAAFTKTKFKVYTRLRPDLLIEAPRSARALYDAQTGQSY